MLRPGPSLCTICCDLCRSRALRGNLVSDAHHAALVIEHGGVWATSDSDCERFPDLLWIHPLHHGLGRQSEQAPDVASLATMIAEFRRDPSRFSGGARVILQGRCRTAIRQRPSAARLAHALVDSEHWSLVEAFARLGR